MSLYDDNGERDTAMVNSSLQNYFTVKESTPAIKHERSPPIPVTSSTSQAIPTVSHQETVDRPRFVIGSCPQSDYESDPITDAILRTPPSTYGNWSPNAMGFPPLREVRTEVGPLSSFPRPRVSSDVATMRAHDRYVGTVTPSTMYHNYYNPQPEGVSRRQRQHSFTLRADAPEFHENQPMRNSMRRDSLPPGTFASSPPMPSLVKIMGTPSKRSSSQQLLFGMDSSGSGTGSSMSKPVHVSAVKLSEPESGEDVPGSSGTDSRRPNSYPGRGRCLSGGSSRTSGGATIHKRGNSDSGGNAGFPLPGGSTSLLHQTIPEDMPFARLLQASISLPTMAVTRSGSSAESDNVVNSATLSSTNSALAAPLTNVITETPVTTCTADTQYTKASQSTTREGVFETESSSDSEDEGYVKLKIPFFTDDMLAETPSSLVEQCKTAPPELESFRASWPACTIYNASSDRPGSSSYDGGVVDSGSLERLNQTIQSFAEQSVRFDEFIKQISLRNEEEED